MQSLHESSTNANNCLLCAEARRRRRRPFWRVWPHLSNPSLARLCSCIYKMSMLPPEIANSLTQLLQALSSGDNALRSQAEEQLNSDWTANRPDVLLMGLVEQIQSTQDTAVGSANPYFRTGRLHGGQTRSFAAVLFRRMASKNRKDPITNDSQELFLCLGDNEKNFIRQRLLQCLANEQTPSVRHKIGDAVAEVARQYTDNST